MQKRNFVVLTFLNGSTGHSSGVLCWLQSKPAMLSARLVISKGDVDLFFLVTSL